jgi:hypothetical protein
VGRLHITGCLLQAAYKYGGGDILPHPFFHLLLSSIGGISPHAMPPHLSKLLPKRGLINKIPKIYLKNNKNRESFLFQTYFLKITISSAFKK